MGVKVEVEKSRASYQTLSTEEGDVERQGKKGVNEWVELSVEIPGFRDDDSMPVFLGALLSEALLADGELVERLYINERFHWKVYLDVSSSSSSISLMSLCLTLRFGILICKTDLATVTTTLIPSTASLAYNTSRSTFNTHPSTKV